jgi:hypothetical protein
LGRRVNAEFEFAFLAVVDRKAFHQQGAEAGAGTATERMEDKEALETTAVVCDSSNLVEHLINELLADGVVPTCVVV